MKNNSISRVELYTKQKLWIEYTTNREQPINRMLVNTILTRTQNWPKIFITNEFVLDYNHSKARGLHVDKSEFPCLRTDISRLGIHENIFTRYPDDLNILTTTPPPVQELLEPPCLRTAIRMLSMRTLSLDVPIQVY